MGLPNFFKEGNESLLKDLLELAKKEGATHVISGALLSDYQRQRMGYLAHKLGMKVVNPLWRIDQEKYMRKLIDYGFEFIIVRIASMGLDPEFLGKVLTKNDVERIIELSKKFKFNPAFEGGEAETLVTYAPLFKKRLIVKGEPRKRGPDDWVYVIKEAHLE